MLGFLALFAPAEVDAKKIRPEGLVKAAVASLHPTQGAVGMREVARKRAEVEAIAGDPRLLDKFLGKRSIPVVVGPGGGFYMIDHHHLALALLQAKIGEAYVEIGADLSALTMGEFWVRMEADGRLHPFDEAGRKIMPSQLPRTLAALGNDPYRDLAGSVREAGGFDKTRAPYSEFSWADFFRARVAAGLIASDYDAAVRQGIALARGIEAKALPGYVGR